MAFSAQMFPTGIEPAHSVPETDALSTELRELHLQLYHKCQDLSSFFLNRFLLLYLNIYVILSLTGELKKSEAAFLLGR